jgi:hypothetical protein
MAAAAMFLTATSAYNLPPSLLSMKFLMMIPLEEFNGSQISFDQTSKQTTPN